MGHTCQAVSLEPASCVERLAAAAQLAALAARPLAAPSPILDAVPTDTPTLATSRPGRSALPARCPGSQPSCPGSTPDPAGSTAPSGWLDGCGSRLNLRCSMYQSYPPLAGRVQPSGFWLQKLRCSWYQSLLPRCWAWTGARAAPPALTLHPAAAPPVLSGAPGSPGLCLLAVRAAKNVWGCCCCGGGPVCTAACWRSSCSGGRTTQCQQ